MLETAHLHRKDEHADPALHHHQNCTLLLSYDLQRQGVGTVDLCRMSDLMQKCTRTTSVACYIWALPSTSHAYESAFLRAWPRGAEE
jgi:hypothetical protein